MKIDQFNKIIREQTEECLRVLETKSKEYDNDPTDRLKDFKQAARLQNTNQIRALSGMLSKQVVSLFNFCTEGQPTDYPKEKWVERISDITSYLLILRAMIEEEYADAKRKR